MAFNKKELVEFIQDSLIINEGLSPTMVKDIEQIIKTQVDMGDADEFIKSLDNNKMDIKRLLEDVLEGRETVEPNVEIKTSNNINVDAPVTNNTPPVSNDSSEGQKFRDVIKEQVRNNNDLMSKTTGLMRDVVSEGYDAVGGQVNTILGEEKTNLIDPLVDMASKTKSIVGHISNFKSSLGEGSPIENTIDMPENTKPMVVDGLDGMMDTISDKFDDGLHLQNEQLDQLAVINGVERVLDDTLKIQNDQLKLSKDESLRLQREDDEEDDGSLLGDFIKGILIAGIAGLISGGIVGAMLLPFKVVFDTAKSLSSIFTSMFRTGEKVIDGGEKVGGIFSKIGKIFTKFSIIKKLVNGVNVVIGVLKSFKSWITGFDILGKIGRTLKLVSDVPGNLLKLFASLYEITDASEKAAGFFSAIQRTPIIGKMITRIIEVSKSIYNGTSILGSAMRGVKSLGGVMLKALAGVRWIFSQISVFTKTFGWGLKLLAWPLTILMGVVDFIKGFIGSSETTFLGKITDGIKEAVMGFFEMPIRLLGWVYDKVLGIFGVESSGSGDRFVKAFGGLLDLIIDPILNIFGVITSTMKSVAKSVVGVVGGIFTIIGNIIGAIWNVLTFDFKGLVGNISGIKDGVLSLFTNIFKGLLSYLLFPFKMVGSVLSSVWDKMSDKFDLSIFDPLINIFESISNFMGGIGDTIKNKLSKIPGIGRFFKSKKESSVSVGDAFDDGGLISPKGKETILPNGSKLISEVDDHTRAYMEHAMRQNDKSWGGSNVEKSVDRVREQVKPEKKGGFLSGIKNFFTGDKKTDTQNKGISDFIGDNPTGPIKHYVEDPETGKLVLVSETPAQKSIISDPQPRRIDGNQMTADVTARAAAIRRQIESSAQTTSAVNKMNKDVRDKPERPVVVNTGGESQRSVEPPEDIESMSILFLNKSWGLG